MTKLNAAGTALTYSTYLGGSDFDSGNGIAVDSSGNAYVTGYTGSTNFPVTAGARQTSSGGGGDAFVTKLNATGTALIYSTYLGGSSLDSASSIALDSSGSAYVTGETRSTNFPVTAGARQSTLAGYGDVFVAKFAKNTPTLSLTAGGTVVVRSGSKLTASVAFSGGYNATGTLTFTLKNSSGTVVYISSPLSVDGDKTYGGPTTNVGYLPTIGGVYTWRVSYNGDSENFAVTSSNVTQTANAAPLITSSPANRTINSSQNTTFSAGATGYPAPAVRWRVSTDGGATFTPLTNNSVYSGVTTTTLTITNAAGTLNNKRYQAVFTNTIGSATTTAAILKVVTVSQVSDASVNAGQNATFTEVSTGAADTVQWQVSTNGGTSFAALVNGGQYSGVTTPTLTVSGATSALNQNRYRAVITNAAGSLTTNAAKLTVLDIITAQPSDRSINAGQNATFATASGYASDAVQWYVSNNGGGTFTPLSNGSVYAGVTTTTLTITGAAASLNGNQYRAIFTQLASTPYAASLVTNPAFLTVDSIKKQPSNQRFGDGQTVSFTATSVLPSDAVQWTISTDGGSTYQPLSNSGPYNGVTTTTLTITGATAAMASNEYQALFTNAAGSFASVPVALVPVTLWDSDTAPNSVQEGAATNQTVGITAAADLNDGDALTYHLTDDAGGRFAIDAASGVVRVALGNLINSQAAGGYTITAEARDPAGNTVTSSFAVSVTSVAPSVPTDSDPRPNSVIERAATGTQVGVTGLATNLKPITYALTDDASGRFAINPVTGVVTVANGNLLTYATATSHTITVQASDSQGGASARSFTIRVTSSAANALSIGGFALVNVTVNGNDVSGDSNLPLAGIVHLSGTVLNGQYSLSTTALSGVTVDGFTLDSATFRLTNSGLSLAGAMTLPLLGIVNLAGPIQHDDDFSLAASAPLPTLGGYTMTAATITPSTSGVGVEVQANLPALGNLKLAGVIASSSSYTLSAHLPTVAINGYTLSNTVVTLSHGGLGLAGDASLPVVGTVHLSGAYENGQYTLTANLPDFTLAGVRLTGGTISLNGNGVNLAGIASLPVVGTVALSGAVPNASQYSLSASVPGVTLGGISLSNTTVTLKSNGVFFDGTATLPLVGNIALSGPVQDASHYTLTAMLPHLSAGGFALDNIAVNLSDGEIGLSGTATLPVVGTVPLTGTVLDDSHFSFRSHLPTLGVGGFTLTDTDVILTNDGLRLVGDATLPVIGNVRHIQGSVQDATHFSFSVPVPTVAVGQFSLANDTVTLSNAGNGVTLGLTGDVNLPLFGTVTLTGDIDPSGSFSFSRSLPDFSLPGGAFKVKNTAVTLYTDHVHVDTDISVRGLAEAHFTGDVFANGNYELEANAELTIAGFTIPKPLTNEPNLTFKNGLLEIGFDYGLPGLDAFLPPEDGGVSFSGTYSANGLWSLTATADYRMAIGPVVVTSERITLTPDSLTLGAHGSVADLGPLAEGDVNMTIFRNGTFQATVDVTSAVAGFSLGVANVTFGNHNDSRTLITTLHGVTTLPAGPNVTLDGYWDSDGKYDFRGTQSVAFGPLTLGNAQFAMSNIDGPAAFTFAAGVDFGVFQADVTGHFVKDDQGGFTADSHAKGSVFGALNLDLDGYFNSNGYYEFEGSQDVKLGPLNLTQSEFKLSSTDGLTLSDEWNFLGVFTGTVSAQIGSDNQGIVLTTDAHGSVLGSSLHLHGDIHAANFDLEGSAAVHVGPFTLASADFELSNVTGFTFGSSWNYLGIFSGDVSATIGSDSHGYLLSAHAAGTVFGQTTNLDGIIRPNSYDLRGDARVGLGPLSLPNAHFELSNATGFTFSSGWNYLNAFSGSVTATIGTDAQGYVLDTHAKGRIFGQALELSGTIHPNSYDLEGEAKLGLGIFTVARADFELSNTKGFTFSGSWGYQDVFSGSLTGTIGNGIVAADAIGTVFGKSIELHGNIRNGGRTYELWGNADVGLGPLSLAQADFRLSSSSGFTFSSAWDYRGLFSGSVTGTIGKESRGYFVHVDAEGRILGQTLRSHLEGVIHSNGAFDLKATADLDIAGVSLTTVGLRLSNARGIADFTFFATWDYGLFDGTVKGTIGAGGHVEFEGVGEARLAGFVLDVHAEADLNPAANSYSVNLSSKLGVHVAVVDFSAGATWSGSSMPHLTLSGRANIGGVLARLFEGRAYFTVGTNVVRFSGTFGVPRLPGVSVYVSATVDGAGNLTGIPGINRLPSLDDLKNLAVRAWHELGVAYDDVARGLNVTLGVADQQVADLLKSGGATPDDIKGALKSAFNWSDDRLSNFLGSGGGVVSSGFQNAGNVVTGKKRISGGVPAGSLVYFDANMDVRLSGGEPWGFTTSQGEVTFEVPSTFDTNSNNLLDDSEGQWVVEGGTDITTVIAPVGRFVTPATWEVASPLTTLASAIANTLALTLDEAHGQVLLAMGLPAQLELSSFDPIAEALAGNPLGAQVEAVHARVEDTVAGVSALFRMPSGAAPSLALTDIIQSVLAGRIAQSTSPIDFADASTIAAIIHETESRTGITLDTELVTTAATVIASSNQRIDTLPLTANLMYLSEVAKIRTVAQGAVADDLASAAAGQMSIADVIARDTGAGLSAQIAAARTPPWVVVPLNMTAAATSPSGAPVDFDVRAYDLAGQPLTPTLNFPSGSIFPLGTTTIVASATDLLGNTSTSSFAITVLPTTPPTLTLPANLFVEATMEGGANVTLPQATATDPLDPAPQVSADHNSGYFPIGTTTVWVTATDTYGNSSTDSFTVAVLDTTPPELSPLLNLVFEADQDGGASITLPSATASDVADPSPQVIADRSSGFFPLGTTSVTVTATDADGNATTGTFTVTVVDTSPPMLLLPEDLEIEASQFGGAVVTLPPATATDLVDPSPLIAYDRSSGFFPLGTTPVNVTATDTSGNVTTGTFSVTVRDTTAPVLALPTNLVAEADRTGGAIVTLPPATATDLADSSPIVAVDQASGFLPLGLTVIGVTATDAFGNVSYGTFTVTVVDTVAPTLELPANVVIPANISGGAIVTLPPAIAADLADPAPQLSYDHYSGSFPVGTTTVRVTARDSSGNSIEGSFTVTVVSTTPPTLSVPPNLVVESTVPGGGALIALPLATATSVADPSPVIAYDHASGFFPLGTTTIRVTATDAAGNASTDTFDVTVVDTTPPALTLPSHLVFSANTPGGAIVTLPAVTASDLVDAQPVITFDHPSGFFPYGTTTVRVTTTDAAANVSRGTFTVTVAGISTNTTLTGNGTSTSTYGDMLRFTVTVAPAFGATIPDGETVTLLDTNNGNAVVGTGTLLAGSATVRVPRLNAGTHGIVASFSETGEYAASQSGVLTQVVNQRPLRIQAVTNTKNFDGTTSASAVPVVTGLQSGDNIVGLTELYTTATVGSGKTLVPFGMVSDGNSGQNYSVTFINNFTGRIGKAAPVLTWANPADITVGTSLGFAQLNATADVAGTFMYSPPLGTVLLVGNGQTLSVTFSPDNSADYEPTTTMVLINVLPPNNPPTLNPIDSLTLEAGAGAIAVQLNGITAGPVSEAGQKLTITAVSDRPDLVPNPTVTMGPTDTAALQLTSIAAVGVATITVTVKDDGGTDNGGVDMVQRTFTVTLQDTTPPTTSATTSGVPGNGTWYLTPVTVFLNAADGGSGVAHTFFQVDSGEWTIYTGEFSVAGDGSHSVAYYSVDGVGNAESAQQLSLQIDTHAPVTSVAAEGVLGNNGWYTSAVHVSLVGSDDASGVAARYIRIDGGDFQPYTGPTLVDGEGRHTISYHSVDIAGNVEDAQSSALDIDGTPPTISGYATTADGNIYEPGTWANQDVTVHFTTSDAVSGIASSPTDVIVSAEGGGQSVSGTAIDQAGNSASAAVVDIRIDKTAPITTVDAHGYLGDWVYHPVVITLHVADQSGLSGVQGSYYAINGGDAQVYDGTVDIVLTEPSIYTVTYGSMDNAKNVESRTLTVLIRNNPPTAADNTVTTNEDTTYTFSAGDFHFSDLDASDSFNAVEITTMPSRGTLYLDLNGNHSNDDGAEALSAMTSIGVADLHAGRLRFEPAAEENGTAYTSFTFRVSDGEEYSALRYSISVDVVPVNDRPVFRIGPNQTVSEDAGPQTVGTQIASWATNISPGPADEANQTLTFVITANSYPALFSAGPSITSEGILTYTTATHIHGTAEVFVQLRDDGGVANGGADSSSSQTFTITVTAVADAPLLSAADASGNESATIPLAISVALVDPDGSESLSVQISGIPAAASLTNTAGDTLIPAGGMLTLRNPDSQLPGLSITMPDDASFSLTVTATATESSNDDMASSEARINVAIHNVAPKLVLDPLGATAVDENGVVTLSGTYRDVGALDTHTLTIDWGEGAPQTVAVSGGTFSIQHQYLDDNPTSTPSDTYTISVVLTDDDTGTDSDSTLVTISNVAPELLTLSATSAIENGMVTLSGTYRDMGTLDMHTIVVDWGVGETPSVGIAVSGGSFTVSHQYIDDNPTGTASDLYTIGVTLTDDDTGTDAASTKTTVTNAAPTMGAIIAQADPVAVTTLISVSANFTDPGVLDTHTAVWDWGDGSTSAGTVSETNGSGSVSGSHAYSAAGVYTVTLTVTDDDTGAGTSYFQYVVVYDPSAGFVTGGGWINSPAGAYTADPTLTGKATFGFNSKYLKGSNVPTGNTEFQFKVADFNFKSTSYEWLVVSGAKARFRGVGSINGAGSYGFELTAWDGQINGGGGTDLFRIKIWNQNQGNGVVYDNMLGASDGVDPTTALGGGSIVIHKDAQALLASAGAAVGLMGETLTQSSLNQAVDQAIDYWRSTGVDAGTLGILRQTHVQVADLSDDVLGIASATDYVWIDRDAAGYGWQIDSLGATSPSVTAGIDLLSVVAHELGHKLGWEHSHDNSDLMSPTINVGVRTLVSAGQPPAFLGASWPLPSSFHSDVARLSSRDTTRLPEEDFKETLARDQLFASLDTGPVKPGLSKAFIADAFVSDLGTILDSEAENLPGEDFMEAIALAQLTSRSR